jgi:hypothetical protein
MAQPLQTEKQTESVHPFSSDTATPQQKSDPSNKVVCYLDSFF